MTSVQEDLLWQLHLKMSEIHDMLLDDWYIPVSYCIVGISQERVHFILAKGIVAMLKIWKVMASVFWVLDGIIMADYFQKGQKINGASYASVLRQFQENIKTKHYGNLSVYYFTMTIPQFTNQSLPWLPIMNMTLKWSNIPFTLLNSIKIPSVTKLGKTLSGTHFHSDEVILVMKVFF